MEMIPIVSLLFRLIKSVNMMHYHYVINNIIDINTNVCYLY